MLGEGLENFLNLQYFVPSLKEKRGNMLNEHYPYFPFFFTKFTVTI